MFDGLSGRLDGIFERLKRRGSLSNEEVEAALRDIRVALLEADVALDAAKDFIEKVRVAAAGADVIQSVTPGQQVVKIVHDQLVEMLGGEATDTPALLAGVKRPAVILMVGLQGSGKTTSSAKLALWLKQREKAQVMMASLDVNRPAAQEQLRLLGEQAAIETLPIIEGQQPVQIAERALEKARLGGFDVLILDSAGRLHVDDDLMAEVEAIRKQTNPQEILLVADSMTGQDAANTAKGFHDALNLTGIILTRIDGDSRGGAALSMRTVTGAPIRFLGVGEGLDKLDHFDARRVAGRILGMGDIVALVEQASSTIEQDEAEKIAKKMQAGRFDLEDMAAQLKQMRKIGGVDKIMGLLPGMGNKAKAALDPDQKKFIHQEAIISSMTREERRNPGLIHASRKKRIAAGSGTAVPEVNKLLKQHQMMEKMMRQMKKSGGGLMGALTSMMGGAGMGGGGMPAGMPPGLPPGLAGPGMDALPPGLPPGMPPMMGGGGDARTQQANRKKAASRAAAKASRKARKRR